MSDTSQGPGWWLASDGKWYPPELWTGPPEARPGDAVSQDPTASSLESSSPSEPSGEPGPAAGSGPEPILPGMTNAPGMPNVYEQPPGSPTPGSYPAGGSPTYGYGQPGPYPTAIGKRTNGLAIAALVCGIAGIIFVTAVLGVVFGFVARSQIRRSSSTQGGEGLALAGIILGFAWIVLLIALEIAGAKNNTNSGVVLVHLAAASPRS
jgi:Domain of unknown function (DUF4190)